MKFIFVIPDMSWLWDYKAQFSLGVLYLTTQLKKMGCEVYIYDTNINHINNIPDSDVYAFSTVYNTYKTSMNLAKEIKKIKKSSKIIIGGVHPTTDSQNIDDIFDSIFIGQSELTICDYVNDLKNGECKNKYIQKDLFTNLDEFYPDRSILPLDYVKTTNIFSGKELFDNGGSTSIIFSRGCPFKCSFCSSPVLYRSKMSFRSIPSIIHEIKDIISTYNIRQFRVQDDTFTCSRNFVNTLTEELKRLNIWYRCSTRVNVVEKDIIKQLYESGCREIGLGIEVADNNALKILRKGITVEQAEKSINIIKRFPIKIRCFFMMGLPFDSIDTMNKNINFIERNKIDNVVVGNFIPFPGNDMHINMRKYNILKVKEDTCMNIGQHLSLSPNILRTDINEEKHSEIMKVFYDYLLKRGFI